MRFVLDLLRHGHALPADEGGDDLRRLSDRGRAEIERLGARLRESGWRPARAFTSPLARARESATLLLSGILPGSPERLEQLRPEGSPDEVLEALTDLGATTGHVLLVGHQPLLGLLAGRLTGGSPPGFATGSLVRIEFAEAPAPGAGIEALRLSGGP